MINPLFGTSLFGETLFAQGLVVVLVIPVYSQNSKYADYKVLQVHVLDGRVLKTEIRDIRILKSNIEEVAIHGGN